MIQYFPIVTGSLTVLGNINVSGSITTNSTITAQTLVVQTITSSISSITGSTNFGSLSSNTHNFTGSMYITGAFYIPSGSVGIGINSPLTAFDIRQPYAKTDTTRRDILYASNEASTPAGLRISITGGASQSARSAHLQTTDWGVTNDGIIALQPYGGNVGIGTSSPTQNLSIYASTTPVLGFTNSGAERATIFANSNSLYLNSLTGNDIRFLLDSTERMRITSVGNLLVGTTGTTNTAAQVMFGTRQDYNGDIYNEFSNKSSGTSARYRLDFLSISNFTAHIQYGDNNSSGQYLIYNTGQRVTIVAGGSNGVYLASGATSWTSNSDERLKNINGNIEGALESLSTLRTVKYSWKADSTNKENLGLIAQDVEKVFPQVIDKNHLTTDDKGTNDGVEYLGVKYQDLVPVLVKAIQELNTKFEDYKATHP